MTFPIKTIGSGLIRTKNTVLTKDGTVRLEYNPLRRMLRAPA